MITKHLPSLTFITTPRPKLPLAGLVLLGLLLSFSASQLFAQQADPETPASCQKQQALHCLLQNTDQLSPALTEVVIPNLVAPPAPTPPPLRQATGANRVITYEVITRGNVTSDLNTFKQQAQQTYDDPNGWRQLGITFSPVASGGHFSLVLASADQLPLFSSICSSDYSCRVGRYVIINQDRWDGATPSWNNANGSLRDYRHMVINHETGHWLGHGHRSCGGAGQPAPVMQQQSIDLAGCKFNPWPLGNELFSPTLGL